MSQTTPVENNLTAMPAAFFRKLEESIFSGSQVLWIYTEGDEGRVEDAIRAFAADPSQFGCNEKRLKVYEWDYVWGCEWNPGPDTYDPLKSMVLIPDKLPLVKPAILDERHRVVEPEVTPETNGVVLMRDFHSILNLQANIPLRRGLIELCKNCRLSHDGKFMPIIILANTPTPHNDIKEYVTVVDVTLPDAAQMRQAVVDYILASAANNKNRSFDDSAADDDLRNRVAESMLGLTLEEGRRIFAESLRRYSRVVPETFEYISDEKTLSVRKIDGLTYIPHRKIVSEAQVGGFENFIDYLHDCKFTYTKIAQQLNMERPRGVVLLGPPGTGKTTVGKLAARILGLDLVMLDISSMFQSFVGASEQRIRTALNVVSAMKNVALMVDEIDKALAGAHKNQVTDSGVSSRVLSYLLSWLSNRNMADANDNRTFVIVTMNRTDGIPPEMLRAGRFDRIFSTRLPGPEERRDILAIHMGLRGLDPSRYEQALDALIEEPITGKFTGGELEEIVVTARRTAFSRAMREYHEGGKNRRTPSIEEVAPSIDDFLGAVKMIVPVAKTDAEEIERLEQFCEERTVSVSSRTKQQNTKKQRSVSTRRSSSAN